MGDKSTSRWGPAYLDEVTSPEFRFLSSGAKELWMVLTARTRSAGKSQETKKGFYVSSLELSNDLAKPVGEKCLKQGKRPIYRLEKKQVKVGYETRDLSVRVCETCGGRLEPLSLRTIGRYLKELKEAGMVEVTQRTGFPLICVTPPPTVVDKLRKSRGKRATKPTKPVRSIGQNSDSDRTAIGVRQSNNQRTIKQFISSSDGEGTIKKMSEVLVNYHRIGVVPANEYKKFDSWAAVAVEIPQAVRQMFRSMIDGLSSEEFDQTIRDAGVIALSQLKEPRQISGCSSTG